MHHQLTVIIPVFNEQDNLYRVRDEFLNWFPHAQCKSKVLFVDDGSKDNSLELIREICESHEEFGFLSFDRNYGLSAAIKAGFDAVDTELTGYIDADLQTSPEDFDLLYPYISDFELVTGVRADRKDSFVKNMSSKIANGIRRSFTQDGMDDTGCPLKIIKTEYARKIPMFNGLHRFLPAMILLQHGRIKQVPVRHFERTAGKSKFHLMNRLVGPLQDCFAYLWMRKKYIDYKVAQRG